MKMHESLTEDRIVDAAKSQMFDLANPGFCVKCGEEHDQCEPDARNYKCSACGKMAVFGAQELLLYLDG